jgi:5-methylthioribose kinase
MAITKSPAYETLTGSSSVALVIKLGLFSGKRTITSQELGTDNQSLVFRVTDQENNKSVLIKQTLPFGKVNGESLLLHENKAGIESNALIRQALTCPHLVPSILYSDTTLAVSVIEDLSHLTSVWEGLLTGAAFPNLSRHLGEFLGKTSFYNSEYFLDPLVKKRLVQQFSNHDRCAKNQLFDNTFSDSDTSAFDEELRGIVEHLRQDHLLLNEVDKLKKKCMSNTETFNHGNLHPGNVFADQKETKIMNPEFAFFGPIGFDIGQFTGNLLLLAVCSPEENRSPLFSRISELWEEFSNTFIECFHEHGNEQLVTEGFIQESLKQIFIDAAGFAGCEMIRRTLCADPASQLVTIFPPAIQTERKTLAIRYGQQLIKEHENLTNTKDLITLFTRLTEK